MYILGPWTSMARFFPGVLSIAYREDLVDYRILLKELSITYSKYGFIS